MRKHFFILLLVSVGIQNLFAQTPSFAAKVDFTTGNTPYFVAIGDLDGDSKPDLVVVNGGTNTVSVFRNTSTSGSITASSFASKVDFTTGTIPYSVAIGDLDGDGKPDLVVTNTGSNNVSVFRNTSVSGSITFASKVDFTAGAGPISVAIGDLDGDGKPDLAVANYDGNTVSVFRNTSSSGSITFAAKIDFTAGAGPRSVAIGDVDGDGKFDLVVENATGNTVSVFRNTSASGSITASSFASKVDFTTGSAPNFVATGDLDGDGKPDLVVANTGIGTVSVFRNTSTSGTITASSFAAKVDFTAGGGSSGVAIGDVDGDGKPDLVVANQTSNTVSVMRNTSTSGSITFAVNVDFATGASPRVVAIGDLDGDGKPDLVVANTSSNTVSVLGNTTTASPSATTSAATSIGSIYATLNGTVNPNSSATTAYFEWGTSSTLATSSSTSSQSIGSGSGAVSVSANLGGLSLSTTYYYRVVGQNGAGTTRGSILSFTTSSSLAGEYATDANTVLLLHLNETSGIAVSDVSGFGNNGTATGTTPADGRFGKARSFNGSLGNYVEVPDASSLDLNDFTVEAWVKLNSFPGTQVIVCKGGDYNYQLLVSSSHTLIGRYNPTGLYEEVDGATILQVNTWYHLALTYNSTTHQLRLVLNGVEDGKIVTTRYPPHTQNEPVTIGSYIDHTYIIDGLIDEARISNIARSPSAFNLQLPPTNLSASVSATTINLTWQNGGGAVSLLRYRIYRGTDSTNISLIDSTSSTSYSNIGLTANTRYFYRVSPVDATGFEGARGYAASALTTTGTAMINLFLGNNQTGAINTTLSNSFVIRVTDGGGIAVQGASVVFAFLSVPTGATGHALSNTNTTTNSTGHSATMPTLGNKIGNYLVTASSSGLSGSPVLFTATATSGPAATISLTSGNNQSGRTSTSLSNQFVITVTDSGGNVVQGSSVTFAVASIPSGATGYSLSTSSTTTSSSGQASSTLTFGDKAGTYTVTATSSSSGLIGNPVTFTATATASSSLCVSTTGNDANAGTPAVPLRNIQTALTRASSGDTVKVAAGTFSEILTTAVKVVLRGGYDATFTESARNLYKNKTVVKPTSGTILSDANSSTIDGFVFDGSGGAGKGILVTAGNSMITHNVVQGVSASGGSCIEVASTASATIKNNTVASNLISGGGVIVYSIYVKGNVGGATVVQNNIAFNNDVGISISASGVTTGYNCSYGNRFGNFDNLAVLGATDLSKDPKLLNPSNSDFRLKASSPCINTGNPTDPVGAEPSPSGNRIDMGSYGGTSNATPNGNPTTYVATTGNDANDGSISTPFKTIQTALNSALGDTVKVAAGSFSEGIITGSQAVLLGGYDNTFAESKRDIFANRTTLVGVSSTMLYDRYSSTVDGFFLNGNNVAQTGLDISTGATVTHTVLLNISAGFGYGIIVNGNATVTNNTLRNITRALTIQSGAGTVVKNNIFASNTFALTNSAANGIAKYNGYFGNSFNYVGSFTTPGTGDLAVNPQFRDVASNDYRLSANSPCIDAGDPTDPVGDEPAPNNGRIDMGAYGGTKNAGGPVTKLLGEYLADANTVLLLHMNETSGSTVSDASGNNNNGTAIGTTIVGGRFGRARQFNTSGETVTVSNSASLNIETGSFTLEAWVNTLTFQGGGNILIRDSHPGPAFYHWVLLPNGIINFEIYQSTSMVNRLTTQRSIADGKWHHFAGIVTPNSMFFYIDGALDNSVAITFPVSSAGDGDFILGLQGAQSNPFNGIIDEVRISKIVRSPNEFNLQLPPKNLSVSSVTSAAINLTWQNGGGAVPLMRYRIYRGADSTSISLIDSTTQLLYSNPGLTASTRYFYRISAVDSTGFEGAKSYATSATTGGGGTLPTVSTLNATNIGSTSATLIGTVNPNGSSTTAYFEWGTSSSLASSTATASQSIGSGTSAVSVTANLTGLSASTTYYYRVVGQNSAGTSRGSIESSTTSASGTAPTVTTDSPANITTTTAQLRGTINPNGLNTTVTFQYGTTTSYGSTVLATATPVSGSSAFSISATITGLSAGTTYHYRVVGTNSAGVTNGTDQTFVTYSTSYTASTTVSFPSKGNASSYSATDYRIFGLPGASGVSVSSILSGSQNVDWQVYWDNGASSNFLVSYNGSANFNFSVGKAFWVISKTGVNISLSVTAATLNAQQEAEIPLQSGWNLITNPFTTSITWSKIQTVNGTTGSLYSFNNSFSSSASFDPYVGYYYFNGSPNPPLSMLRVPYASIFGKVSDNQQNTPGSWKVNVALKSGDIIDRDVWFGIDAEAKQTLDPKDLRKPRGVGAISEAYFDRPEWDIQYPAFASDIRSNVNGIERWDFTLNTPELHPSSLTLSGVNAIPGYFSVYLIDETRAKYIDLRRDSAYEFVPTVGRSRFSVLVGRQDEVTQKLQEVVPKEFELGQNFPNPFNPSTTIPVSVPLVSEAQLIIYNILGQKVKTLYSGTLEAGKHWFQWDGKDNNGRSASSGVYLYRLSIGGRGTRAGKMILMQ